MVNIDAIVDELYSDLTDKDKEFLNTLEKSPFDGQYGIELHFTTGMQIRNKYKLWEDGACGDRHPDDVSGEILHKLICRVKGEPSE